MISCLVELVQATLIKITRVSSVIVKLQFNLQCTLKDKGRL